MKISGYLIIAALFTCSCMKEAGAPGDSGANGKGGSMARFAIKGDLLYTVSIDSLKLFNIEDAANPIYHPERDMKVGFEVETIFPMDSLLFVGSRNGMFVYDISEPRFPMLLSQVTHIRSCDPVVASDNYAYVTLNTMASNCGRSPNNVLHVYDISNPIEPILKRTLFMNGPKGLGVDGNKLFVCDRGLKVFDISDPLNIRQVDDLVDVDEVDIRESYDVIPVDGLLILVAQEGLYQLDYTGDRLKFVSKIEIKKETP
ncbi:MAG: hypothetical protein LBC84_05670 [Prevotellaceae bacterium]|jgi:hypothetical protein|nr:hypothetical protein [Prevotellaceae bacterium]